jgi:hypothetical protein
MKAKDSIEQRNLKAFKVNTTLNGKYEDQPLFKEKVDRANHILKTFTLPKEEPSVRLKKTGISKKKALSRQVIKRLKKAIA